MKDHEDDEEICQTRWQQAKSICPSAWVRDELRRFPRIHLFISEID